MASDPADLIREADSQHAPEWINCLNTCCSGEDCRFRSELCRECGDEWPCLVRRLRDALEASDNPLRDVVIAQRDEARAALAEANATIDAYTT